MKDIGNNPGIILAAGFIAFVISFYFGLAKTAQVDPAEKKDAQDSESGV